MRPRRAARRGSVIVVVLVTLVFATTALLLFIERAGSDLLVEARDADANRLRFEAYSALETTLAVLTEFRLASDGLHSPMEGWEDPLAWAGYEPSAGRRVEVSFVDESGKISLPRVDFQGLFELFRTWELPDAEAERLADALLGWMKADYTPKTAMAPTARDYENAELPFHPPERALRSFSELRAIEYVRERFFDEEGQPTELFRRFVNAVSLYDYSTPNINAAPEGVLAALARYDQFQLRQLDDFRRSAGAYTNRLGYFKSPGEVSTVLGEQGVAAGFGATIQALRVIVTVREGVSAYRLEAVVAPPGGAKLVVAPGIPVGRQERQSAAQNQPAPTRDETRPESGGLEYPFTLLEIVENAAMSSAPPEIPTDPTPSLF